MNNKKKPITDEFLIEKMQKQIKRAKENKQIKIGKLYNLNKWTLESLDKSEETDPKLKSTYKHFYKTFKHQIDAFNRKLELMSREMEAILRRKNKDPFHKISLEDLKDIEPRISHAVYEITEVYKKYPTLDDKYVQTYFDFQEKCRDEFHWIDKKTLEKK